MIKTRLYKPYTKTGKTTFPARKKTGVYIFYKNEIVVYVGKSENDVYKAMYRHLQQWNDPSQDRVVYNSNEVKIRIVYCTILQARRLEAALIRKYKPADNLNTPEPVTFSEKSLANITADFFGSEAEPLTDLPF
jgi:excinuclease UvrABC nuclease subunit